MALSVEVAELVEIFQWLTEDESYFNLGDDIESIMNEIGDIQIYLIMLADKFNLCPIQMAKRKLEKNKIKHPIKDNKFKKYT